jgi:group II intron reverse transcriptase/maturase
VNVDEMQKKLSQKATQEPEHQFENLYGLLCNEGWLRVAAHKVLSNEGSRTAGVDSQTKSNFLADLDGNITRLQEALKAKDFEPMPVKRVYIPKPHSEKKRPLGIPTLKDRIVQEALRMTLEPIWEADFSRHSYGFRPNRGTYDAIAYLGNHLTGNGSSYQWVIEGDIASYFDTIPHRKLDKAVKKRVADRDIRDLLWKFLRAGVMYQEKVHETITGTPQGGIVSPLLANIYLHELDRYMESTYLNFSDNERRKRRKQGKSNFLYVRYADDFVVLCNGTKAQALAMKEELKDALNDMGLKLSEEKTKVTQITEGFLFLGYKIIREIGTTGKMVPKVLIPESASKQYVHKLRRMLAPSTTKESVRAKILAINRFTRGWCEYYRCTSAPARIFDAVGNELHLLMAHWLGHKYRSKMSDIMRKYWTDSTFGTKQIKLIRPREYTAKRLIKRAWHNPYTAKEAIVREKILWYDTLWIGNEDRRGWSDIREEVIALKGTTCHICGTELHVSEVEIDHAPKPRARFKDKREADRMKHLQPICTSCHRAKTKADPTVESRMR